MGKNPPSVVPRGKHLNWALIFNHLGGIFPPRACSLPCLIMDGRGIWCIHLGCKAHFWGCFASPKPPEMRQPKERSPLAKL